MPGHSDTCITLTNNESLASLQDRYFGFWSNTSGGGSYTPREPPHQIDWLNTALQRTCSWHISLPPLVSALLGGDEVDKTDRDYKFYVKLRARQFCSGAILSRHWLVSSDHPGCTAGLDWIRYGADQESTATVVKSFASNVTGLGGYSLPGLILYKVKENLRAGGGGTVCLPWIRGVYHHCEALSVGATSLVTRKVKVAHCPQELCRYAMRVAGFRVDNRSICFRIVEPPGAAFDVGDSGAPILCNKGGSQGRPVLIGLYQYARKVLFVSSNVEYYMDWMLDTILREGFE